MLTRMDGPANEDSQSAKPPVCPLAACVWNLVGGHLVPWVHLGVMSSFASEDVDRLNAEARGLKSEAVYPLCVGLKRK